MSDIQNIKDISTCIKGELIMTQEEQILFKVLCEGLPYGVKITFRHNGFRWDWPQTLDEIKKCEDGEYAINGWGLHGIKPYLRSMSSMTEEECKELGELSAIIENVGETLPNAPYYIEVARPEQIDWLNARHFDYRGLIPMGLALEAPEDMYKEE